VSPLRPCLRCGQLGTGSYCASCQPQRKTSGRSSRPQHRFRVEVLDAAGHRCQWVSADGVRCEETSGLQAHHLALFRDTGSYDPADGVALCPAHHGAAERALQALDGAV
jgi:hypothetical protein